VIRSTVAILRRHLTAKRAANIGLSLGSYLLSRFLRQPIVFGQPFMMMIEPTNLCNLRCPLCPTGSDALTRAKGRMSMREFVRLMDESGDYLLHISLWNVGEPFMNEHFIDMVRYAKGKNIYVITSTNGHFMAEDTKVRELVQSGLDEIILSMDGASEETYSRYRKKGAFHTVVDGLKLLAKTKETVGSTRPLIDLQFIVMRHNEHEIEQMMALAKRLKVNRLTLKTVQVTSAEEAEAFLPASTELRRYLYRNGRLTMKGKPKNDCRWLWFCPVVNWDGTVVPCCFDKDNEFPLGNVFEGRTVKEIWHGDRYAALRKRILTARNKTALCQNCSEGLKNLYIKKTRF